MRSRYRAAALLLLAALFVLNIYRAATQSLVHDEAFTYHLYLATPWSAMFQVYDANHHFLSTLLIRLSVTLFGFSELAMRLPTLLAGGWYFVTLFRLSILVFEDGPLFLLAVVLAAANPIVLDFLVAARGYGLALACLTYAIYCVVAWLSQMPPDQKLVRRAAIALGLAVTANLTMLVPAAVIAAVVLVAAPRQWKHLAIPLAAIGLVFVLLAPINRATTANFYVGAPSFIETLRDLAAVSLAHNRGPLDWNRETWWAPWWRGGLTLAVAAMAIVGLRLRASTPHHRLLQLASVTMVGSWIVLIAAHYAIGLPYPVERTGIYFLPLAALVAISCAAVWKSKVVAVVGAVIAVQFLLQVNWTHFYVWRYDADTKTILKILAADHPPRVRLGVSWQLQPAIEYYRQTRHLDWLEPVTRDGPEGDYDFYMLAEIGDDVTAGSRHHTVYHGSVSDTVLVRK